jgi:hypothetical protein
MKGQCLLRAGSLLVPVIFFAAGCGSSEGTVNGKVFFQKKEVQGGTVKLHDKDGKVIASGAIGVNGFHMAKVAPGKYTVTVETVNINVVGKIPGMVQKKGMNLPKDMPEDLKEKMFGKQGEGLVQVPAKYKDPKQSGLSIEVGGGNQEKNIEIE